MLVLSRKSNEEIIIGGSIRVKVLEITGHRVRLGISAPDQVPVMREEVFTRATSGASNKSDLNFVGAAD